MRGSRTSIVIEGDGAFAISERRKGDAEMLAQLSQWILIATLSQAPQEADWLKIIPADVDVAIHVRGLDAVRNDAVAMLKAMSPEWGKMAEDGSEAHLAQIREKHGDHALKNPWVGMI